jgi:hypothetical protein
MTALFISLFHAPSGDSIVKRIVCACTNFSHLMVNDFKVGSVVPGYHALNTRYVPFVQYLYHTPKYLACLVPGMVRDL